MWGLRRLRSTAVTVDPELGMGTKIRSDLHDEMARRVKLPSQEGFGAMDRDAELLEEIT